MNHPHRLLTACSRSAPQGATPAAWQSRFRDVPDFGPFLPASLVNVGRMSGATTGMLRVEAVANRRRAVSVSARGRLV